MGPNVVKVWIEVVAIDGKTVSDAHRVHQALAQHFKSLLHRPIADRDRDLKFVCFTHGSLVSEVYVGVLILVEDDTVAAHLLRSFNLLGKLAHRYLSSLGHHLLDVKLGNWGLINGFTVGGFDSLAQLCRLLLVVHSQTIVWLLWHFQLVICLNHSQFVFLI